MPIRLYLKDMSYLCLCSCWCSIRQYGTYYTFYCATIYFIMEQSFLNLWSYFIWHYPRGTRCSYLTFLFFAYDKVFQGHILFKNGVQVFQHYTDYNSDPSQEELGVLPHFIFDYPLGITDVDFSGVRLRQCFLLSASFIVQATPCRLSSFMTPSTVKPVHRQNWWALILLKWTFCIKLCKVWVPLQPLRGLPAVAYVLLPTRSFFPFHVSSCIFN